MSLRRSTRARNIVWSTTCILVFAMMLPASPGPHDNGLVPGPVGVSQAALEDRLFTIGCPGMDVDSLNPFLYTQIAEWMIVMQCYSTLLMHDSEENIIGCLARAYSVSQDGQTYRFELHDNAYFCDPGNPTARINPVTAEDVAFTYWTIQNDPGNSLYPLLPNVIRDTWTEPDNQYVLYLKTWYPYAPLLTVLTSIPILPKYVWSNVNPMSYSNLPLIGSGPFYYPSSDLPRSEARLVRNPIWFLEESRGWQIHTGELVFRNIPDMVTGMMELELGIVDVLSEVPSSLYVDVIGAGVIENVKGLAPSTGFVYEFNLNQMTDELREELGNAFEGGYNNQLLLDPVVKRAIAMCVDKQMFVDEVTIGLGSVATSLVPESNPSHYEYGGPRAPVGEEQIQFDPVAARQLLMVNGWAYDENGNPATQDTVPLCREGGTVPLSFRFCTLASEESWATGADLLTQRMMEGGILLHGEQSEDQPPDLLTISQMNTVWYTADYDAWLWNWRFSPLSDVSTEVLSVCTSMAIGGWSDIFWANPVYDNLYYESLSTVDPTARMAITDEMQRMLYEEYACQCVAYEPSLYGVNTASWTNYGNWAEHITLAPDIGLPWLYTCVYPTDNHAPKLMVVGSFEADAGSPEPFCCVASDDLSNLEYRWFWGDGTMTDWSPIPAATHAYVEDGIYTAYVACREVDNTDDYFVSWNKTTVTVRDLANYAPTDLAFTFDPVEPCAGVVVTFYGSASDPEGNELYYSWDFGDGSRGLGETVQHQFETDGYYVVTMYVTDNHIGSGTRPVTTSQIIWVDFNHPPTIIVPDYPDVERRTDCTFTVIADDPDSGDTLRYTWDWGDGTVTTTYVNTATHAYNTQGTYTLTVSVSDLTGLPGHIVSDSGTVVVVNPGGTRQGHNWDVVFL